MRKLRPSLTGSATLPLACFQPTVTAGTKSLMGAIILAQPCHTHGTRQAPEQTVTREPWATRIDRDKGITSLCLCPGSRLDGHLAF